MSSLTEYLKWEFLWPARPEKAIPVSSLEFYEREGWQGQIKKNGSCTVLGVSPDKVFHTWNRHNEEHRAWKPNHKDNLALVPFLGLPDRWFVFEGELLHNKVKDIRDTLYLFDILVFDSEFLLGSRLENRQTLIDQLIPDQVPGKLGYDMVPGSKLWIAKPVVNFRKTFDSLIDEEDEGLVLKDPKAKLTFCSKADSNSSWQVKLRTGKKYI